MDTWDELTVTAANISTQRTALICHRPSPAETIATHTGLVDAIGRVRRLSVCLCPLCKKKTARAINNQLIATRMLYDSGSACVDPEFKRSIKVKGQTVALGASGCCGRCATAASVGLHVV